PIQKNPICTSTQSLLLVIAVWFNNLILEELAFLKISYFSHNSTNLLISLFITASRNSGLQIANKKRTVPSSVSIELFIPKDRAYSKGAFKKASAAFVSFKILCDNKLIS